MLFRLFNGYLATITSRAENTEILDTIRIPGDVHNSKWIGFYDPEKLDDPNAWEWVDGTSVTYVRWNNGSGVPQPDGQEFCGRLSFNAYWFYAACNITAGFVCNFNQSIDNSKAFVIVEIVPLKFIIYVGVFFSVLGCFS